MGTGDVTYDDFRDEALRALLRSFADEGPEPPVGAMDRLIGALRQRLGWRIPVRRIVHDRRAQVAAASLGAAILGAFAVGLILRRAERRAPAQA